MPVLRDPAEDVLRPGEGDGELPVGLLHLVLGNGGGAVIRHGGGLDEDVRPRQGSLDGLQHVLGGGHGPERDPHGGLEGGGAGDQGHLRAPEGGLPGDGVAHAAAGVVGEVADGVQGLLGGTGGDGDMDAGEGLLPGQLHGDSVQQDLRLRQLAAAHILAGQKAAGGLDDAEAVLPEGLKVILGDGVFQHGGIHGGGDQLAALGGQDRGGQHIVRDAVGELREDVGGGGGDEDQVRRLREGDVVDIVLKIPGEGVHHAAVVRQGLKGQGGDELGGVFRHDDVDLRPRLAETAGDAGHLIGGDAAGDAQEHTLSGELFHGSSHPVP